MSHGLYPSGDRSCKHRPCEHGLNFRLRRPISMVQRQSPGSWYQSFGSHPSGCNQRTRPGLASCLPVSPLVGSHRRRTEPSPSHLQGKVVRLFHLSGEFNLGALQCFHPFLVPKGKALTHVLGPESRRCRAGHPTFSEVMFFCCSFVQCPCLCGVVVCWELRT